MKNYKKIRRIFEADEMQIGQGHSAEPQMMHGHSEMPTAPQMDAAPQEALPSPGEMTSASDPMSMTVRDFINKCKSIDPLICMGIESFIEKNRMNLSSVEQMEPAAPMGQEELTFSKAVEPQAAEPAQNFSLDQSPETLNFPA